MELDKTLQRLSEILLRAKAEKTDIPDMYRETPGYRKLFTNHVGIVQGKITEKVKQLLQSGVGLSEAEKQIKDLVNQEFLNQAFFSSLESVVEKYSVSSIMRSLNVEADKLNDVLDILGASSYNDLISKKDLVKHLPELNKLKKVKQVKKDRYSGPANDTTWVKSFVSSLIQSVNKELKGNKALSDYKMVFDEVTASAVGNLSRVNQLMDLMGDPVVNIGGSDPEKIDRTTEVSFEVTLGFEQKRLIKMFSNPKLFSITFDFEAEKVFYKSSRVPELTISLVGTHSNEATVPSPGFKDTQKTTIQLAENLTDSVIIPMLVTLKNQDIFGKL